VSIAISDDHRALLDAVRRFTAARCGSEVVRAAVDAEADSLPPFWDEIATLGWLGLHLPESVGGQGHGFVELAIVLEEMGRALAPGPLLPTVLASAVVHSGGGGPTGVLADLADGRAVGSVALGPALAAERGASGSLVVSGTTGPVLCGSLAALVVVPVSVAGVERWCVVSVADAEVSPLGSLDPTDLHVQPDAPFEVIRANYRTLMQKLKLHPDLGGDHWTAVHINTAYAILADPVRRRAYDRELLASYDIATLSRGPLPSGRRSPEPRPKAAFRDQRNFYRILQVNDPFLH